VFERILNSADVGIERFVFGTWESFATSAGPFVQSLLIIAVAVLGYRLITGQVAMNLGDLGYRVFVTFLFATLALSMHVEGRFLYDALTKIPESVGGFLIGEERSGLNQGIGFIYDRGIESYSAIIRDAGVLEPAPYFYGAPILIATVFAVGVVAYIVLLSKIAVGVLLGLAPFALILYFFESTRAIFQGYLRQLLNFALAPVLAYAVAALLFGIVDAQSEQLSRATETGADTMSVIGQYTLVLVVWGLVTLQVLPWSAGIMGGIALNAPNVVQPLLNTARSAGLALQTATRAAQAQVSVQRAANPNLGRVAVFAAGARGVSSSLARSAAGLRQRPMVELYRRSKAIGEARERTQ